MNGDERLKEFNEAALDRLADVLLRQELGAEAIPDVSTAVHARLAARRRLRWGGVALAAAAGLAAILLGGRLLWPGAYPAPEARGTFALAPGDRVGRGATLATADAGSATVVLGGYCRVNMEAATTLRIDGAERQESVFLAKGGVVCEVDGHVGRFAVRTEVGTVSVTGTRFSVRLSEAEGEGAMSIGKTEAVAALVVAVMLGSVNVEYRGRTYELAAGASQAFGAERHEKEGVKGEKTRNGDEGRGKWEKKEGEKKREDPEVTVTSGKSQSTEGTVVRGGETLVLRTANGEEMTFHVKTVKKEGEKKRDIMRDVALRKSLQPGMKVGVSWSAGEDGNKYIDKLSASGTVTGVVVEPREKGILLVKVDGVEGPMRFCSRWVQREGQWVPDPTEVELMASFKTGAKVNVAYELQEHFRVNKITSAAGAGPDAEW